MRTILFGLHFLVYLLYFVLSAFNSCGKMAFKW